MKNQNQRNHLTDLNSDMGLTTKKLQSQLIGREQPHYYEVRNENGERYCHCGSMIDVEYMLKRYPTFTYEKIYFPPSPKTVDVPYVRLDPDKELPEQKILQQSELEPFIPNLHD